MPTRKKPVDAVIIGYGWTGAIMAKTLTDEGLSVVALERGPARDTAPDFEYPRIIDELKYGIRGDLWQPLAKATVTVRHSPNDVASPYRQYGSFVLGTGVGGAGVHWNGQLWRASPEDLRLRSHIEQRYGKKFIPEDMTIQDYPVTFEELEPHFDHFEKVCGVAGTAGNLRGTIKAGGNPFEGPRSDEYPSTPLPSVYSAQLFAKAASEFGYKPFPMAAANSSRAYTNPYGVRLGPCNMCGFCERFGCFLYSKASPLTPCPRRISRLAISSTTRTSGSRAALTARISSPDIVRRQCRISVRQRRACKRCCEQQNEMQPKTAAHGASNPF